MDLTPSNIDWAIRNAVRVLTGKKTLEQERQERMVLLREMLCPGETKLVKPSLSKEYFQKLANDFTLSTVSLIKRDGSVLVTTGGDIKADKGIFDSVIKRIPDARYLLIKGEKKTHVVYPDNGSLLVVEAQGNVSSIEMKALMNQVRKGEKSWHES